MSIEKLLTSEEVAELLGTSASQVRKLRRQGFLVGINISVTAAPGSRSAQWRFQPREVSRFIAAHRSCPSGGAR